VIARVGEVQRHGHKEEEGEYKRKGESVQARTAQPNEKVIAERKEPLSQGGRDHDEPLSPLMPRSIGPREFILTR